MIKLLLQAGCRIEQGPISGFRAGIEGYSYASTFFERIGMTLLEEYDGLMLSHGVWDMDIYDNPFPFDEIGFWSRCKTVWDMLFPRISTKLYDLPFPDRLELLKYYMDWPNPESICLMLWRDGVVSASRLLQMESQGFSLLHTTVYLSAGSEFLRGMRIVEKDYGSWRHGFRRWRTKPNTTWKTFRVEIINRTAELAVREQPSHPLVTDVNSHGETRFSGLLWTILSAWTRWSLYKKQIGKESQRAGYYELFRLPPNDEIYLINTSLRSLLVDLHHCGMDLNAYGHLELEIMGSIGPDEYSEGSQFHPYHKMLPSEACRDTALKPAVPRLETFKFGPLPDDWVFYWDWGTEAFAGEFWTMVEDPQLIIPGSWVDDDEW